jgi:hypothetical protein
VSEKRDIPPWLLYLFNSWPILASVGFANFAVSVYLMREGGWVPLWYRVPGMAFTIAVAGFCSVRCKRIAKNTFRRPKPDLPISPSTDSIPPENQSGPDVDP